MLLADIKLIEASALDINFSHRFNEPGQGKIKVEYGKIEFEAGGVLIEDKTNSTIQVKAAPTISGFRENVEGDDFTLKINIRMLYVYPSDQELDEAFLQENSWYFASFLKTYFKFYADEILSKTSLEGIKLAYN